MPSTDQANIVDVKRCRKERKLEKKIASIGWIRPIA
jgi:hypothetical protein